MANARKHTMNIKIQRWIVLTFAIVLAAGVAGCQNTARGAGKDIEKMGEKIQEKTR